MKITPHTLTFANAHLHGFSDSSADARPLADVEVARLICTHLRRAVILDQPRDSFGFVRIGAQYFITFGRRLADGTLRERYWTGASFEIVNDVDTYTDPDDIVEFDLRSRFVWEGDDETWTDTLFVEMHECAVEEVAEVDADAYLSREATFRRGERDVFVSVEGLRDWLAETVEEYRDDMRYYLIVKEPHSFVSVVAGYRIYEHGDLGDEAPLLVRIGHDYVCTGDFDRPSAEDVLELVRAHTAN